METRNGKTDKMPINRVILMSCGRYNPPTYMHLRMFERARDHLHTLRSHTVLGGVISPVNDFCPEMNLEKSNIRTDLLTLALQNNDWIHLSTWEMKQNAAKSIRDTLQHHQNVLNSFINNDVDNNINNEDLKWIPPCIKDNSDNPPVQIKLLCGVELLESFATPGLWLEEDIFEILDRYGLVVMDIYGGNVISKFIYDSDILSKYMYNINVVTEWIPNEVNSTRIRRALRRGESVKYLLQDNVINSIYKHGFFCAVKNLASEEKSIRMDSRSEKTSSTTNTTTTGPRGRVILMSCGSYNPPTHMHLRMFERARDHLYNLGTHVVVGGVISPVNDTYSKKELASGTHRCEMLKLALQDSDWIRLSTWEIRQTEWTRTRCTLQHHQNILNSIVLGHSDPNRNTIDNEDLEWIPESVRNNDQQQQDQTPVQIKLLCGGDLLESFATPGLWAEEDITEIVRQYGLIVITREGSNPYKFIYDSDVLSKHLHNIQIVTEWIPNEVSSSRIRRALKRGESVKYLLQDAVIDYVYMNGIYGANRPSTIKLELSSIHSSSDYLNADEAKYHDHNNAFLTPSPSDITMKEQSPCDAYTATTTTTTITETATKTTETDVPDSVLQKNLHNNCSPRYSDDQSSTTNSIEDTELAREKFFRSLVNDSLHFGDESSSSLLPPTSRIFSQIDNSQLELPSSARARNELLAFEDTTESELATLCDNTYSEDREEDVLSITCEESSDDLNESFVRNNKDCNKEDCNSSDKANSEDTTSTTTKDGIDRNESLTYDNLEDSDSQATKFEANFEIDGKYLKSLVNLKKCPKKIDDDESIKSDKGDELKVESTPTTIGEEKTLEEKVEEETKKFFQDDISYIKRLRLIINNTPEENGKNQRQQLQGSLDSINLKETKTTVRNAMESMSKKSKSFESIKYKAPMSFKTSEISFCDTTISKLKSDSTSQLITAPEFDAQTDEFCSACCFATTTNEQPSTADVFYTLRSNSPGDEDSTECDICSSCNLRDSNEALDCKKATTTQTLSEATEICEICGEPATCTDEQLTDNTQVVVSSGRSMAVSLPKAKSTIEISRGSYRMSTLDDDQFEIDNCGLQDCKLRSSLDTCNKPEPLYVNIMPRHRQLISEIDCRTSSKFRTDHQLLSESERYNRAPGISFFGPKDEIAMSRSLSVSGAKRLSRKGSYAKKSGVDRNQEKRRYSSVDNLQNRMSFKSSGEKFSKSRDNKFMTSADSIRPRIARSRSLRRSADNVGRFDSSGDNLDSLEENVDTDENGTTTTTTTTTAASDGNKCARVKIRDSDTIKMILTKHGIKIISQKETVL